MMEINLKALLASVNTIALVGASSNNLRDSYKVMQYFINNGYEVFPVNPKESQNEILGRRCYSNLQDIKKKIDMVDIFRAKEFVKDITLEAIKVGVDIIWTQEGVVDHDSALIAKKAGITFIMDKCPKKILEN